MIGYLKVLKRIMSQEAYKSGRVRQAVQDGNREFISLLACVSAIGRRIPATLLYKGESYDLQDTWVEDLGDSDDFFFGASSNGWSNDAFGLQWLTQVFDPATRQIAGRRKRLLLVDGHSSHINMAFINKCWDLNIILLVFPPHSTHRLQPLDVVLFQQLSTAYSNELNAFQNKGLGQISMKKRHFLPLFRSAWQTAFTEENIQRAFEKPGIWPYNPALVLQVITRPITPPQVSKSTLRVLKTPRSSKSIRHFQADYRKNPTRAKLEKLFKANEELAAQAALDQHTKEGLLDALKIEKKCNQRGKRLNVLWKETNGPILFEAAVVREAQAFAAQKKEKEEAERARIDGKKVAAAIKKAQQEAKKAEKVLETATKIGNKAGVEIEERAEKGIQKKAKSLIKPKKVSISKKKIVRFVSTDLEEVAPAVQAALQKHTSSGRVVKTPVIFEKGA